MALGRRKPRQELLWITPDQQRSSPGHAFYDALERILVKGDFDRFVEQLCEPIYAGTGRRSIPPGRYFRMLFVGYFEGIESQRGIAWRVADSLSLQNFLGLAAHEQVPDHSSLTRIRQRLPIEIFEQVFRFVLGLAEAEGLLKGKTVAVDATLLEANAAMRSIVRRDTGEDYNAWLTRLIREEEGIENPTAEDLVRFDRRRGGDGSSQVDPAARPARPEAKKAPEPGKPGSGGKKSGKKKVSNRDWISSTDPDSRIARMKNKSTHLAYKAENVVDLETDLLLSAEIYSADTGDTSSLELSLLAAQDALLDLDGDYVIEELVADKGYHKSELLADLGALGVRSYIPERKERGKRRWKGKKEGLKGAYHGNRRRMKTAKGKRLQKLRSEKIERSFAHMCETGGGRRMTIRGDKDVIKRWKLLGATRNLGLVMRKRFGVGTPRSLQGAAKPESLHWSASFVLVLVWRTADRGRPMPLPRANHTRAHDDHCHWPSRMSGSALAEAA